MSIRQLFVESRSGPPPVIKFIVYLILVLASLATILPFLWMISTSLKSLDQVSRYPPLLLPNPPQFSNYVEAWSYVDFTRYFINSLVIAVVQTIGVIFFTSLAGYAIAKLRFRGRRILLFIIISTMMVPIVINIVPLYIFLSRLTWPIPWLNSYLGVIVPQLGNAFGIFLVTQFMKSLPSDLLDAARMDGCSEFHIFWRIAIPLSIPVLAALAIFTFMYSWNDFLWPLLVINSEFMKTIPLGIATFRSPWANLRAFEMAITTLSCLPVFIMYILLRRQMTEGITLTGIKG